VDGFGAEHMGALAGGVLKAGSAGVKPLVPCTAAGILELLDHYDIPVRGKQVVIVGRSPIVGMPSQVCPWGRVIAECAHVCGEGGGRGGGWGEGGGGGGGSWNREKGAEVAVRWCLGWGQAASGWGGAAGRRPSVVNATAVIRTHAPFPLLHLPPFSAVVHESPSNGERMRHPHQGPRGKGPRG
jgi:hypothetical protein